MPAPTLVTKRLILRPWKPEDLEPFAALNADKRVMEFFPSMLSREESDALAMRIQKEMEEKEYGLWAVEVKEGAPFIGFVGLHEVAFEAPFTPCIEVGWRLAFEHWGKGYAFEAASQVLEYAFNVLGLDEVVSFTTVDNARSCKLMERLGMTRNPAENFDHPRIPEGDPLRLHVLYRRRKRSL